MTEVEKFMPILFKVLFGFVIINCIINLILLFIKNFKMYRLLAIFWPSVLFVFVMQSLFQTGNFAVTLAYSASFFSVTTISMIGFEAIGRRFPLKRYLAYYLALYPLTYLLNEFEAGFTALAMPFAIGTATPLLHTFYYILFKDFKKTSKLQKLLACVYFLQAIHCINFALFRMEPDAQLWGWLTAYAIYDVLAILLPSIALEKTNLSEKERLQGLVSEKTSELNASLEENEKLIRVLLHDASNPLTVMRWYLQLMKSSTQDSERVRLLEKVKKSQNALECIFQKVKDLHGMKRMKMSLGPVDLEECFNDVSFIFGQSLLKKNVSLKFTNLLDPNTKILADKTSFTHSVLSNLISNGLKFSEPNSEIEIIAREEKNNILIEVRDQGPGISQEVLNNLMNGEVPASSLGTSGEKGTGFGLSIVNNFVDSYGGRIEFDSNYISGNPKNPGTKVKITLNKA